LREVLDSNPSVVFFREAPLDDASIGPKGSLGVPLTAGRSIAVDAKFLPLGAPVFLATTTPDTGAPLQRLVMAQDTGGAIAGPVRADLFFGFTRSRARSDEREAADDDDECEKRLQSIHRAPEMLPGAHALDVPR
jgi:membrane-bound lytic murein transglycosylase A